MYNNIHAYCKENKITLVVVSKTQSIEAIRDVYQKGQRLFGENRVQELVDKYGILPKDIEWHLIGHLQKNKVKYIAPFIAMIHSADSWELLTVIDKEALKNKRKINVLLQYHIAQEETKYGLSEHEGLEIVRRYLQNELPHIQICGVMGMATFTDDQQHVRKEFQHLKSIFDHLKNKYFPNEDYFKEISMGMSGDYKLAIEEGSTIVRVGSAIFQ